MACIVICTWLFRIIWCFLACWKEKEGRNLPRCYFLFGFSCLLFSSAFSFCRFRSLLRTRIPSAFLQLSLSLSLQRSNQPFKQLVSPERVIFIVYRSSLCIYFYTVIARTTKARKMLIILFPKLKSCAFCVHILFI